MQQYTNWQITNISDVLLIWSHLIKVYHGSDWSFWLLFSVDGMAGWLDFIGAGLLLSGFTPSDELIPCFCVALVSILSEALSVWLAGTKGLDCGSLVDFEASSSCWVLSSSLCRDVLSCWSGEGFCGLSLTSSTAVCGGIVSLLWSGGCWFTAPLLSGGLLGTPSAFNWTAACVEFCKFDLGTGDDVQLYLKKYN